MENARIRANQKRVLPSSFRLLCDEEIAHDDVEI